MATFAEIFDDYLETVYRRTELANDLEEQFNALGARRVLDCACGTGFGLLDLVQRGWDLEMSDGSAEMLQQLRFNAARMGVDVNPLLVSWKELGDHFGPEFDLVVCRGNSLAYLNSWDAESSDGPEPAREGLLRESLQGMAGCVRPGGRLLVDLPAPMDGEDPKSEREYPEVRVEGRRVSVRESVSCDPETGVRDWLCTVVRDGEPSNFRLHSRQVRLEQLGELLEELGFEPPVQAPAGKARRHFDSYVARRPA